MAFIKVYVRKEGKGGKGKKKMNLINLTQYFIHGKGGKERRRKR